MSTKDMDFQTLLFRAGNALTKDEVRALVFLCTELLQGSRSASVNTAKDLFSILGKQDHLTAERPQLLTELLVTIERKSLIRHLDLQMPTTDLIPSYRKLLYNLAMDLTVKDLDDVKFLLETKIPSAKLDNCQSILDVFVEMEHMDLLSNTNLTLLEEIISKVLPVWSQKIVKFKEDWSKTESAACHLSVPEEMPPPESKSYYVEPNQVNPSSEPQIPRSEVASEDRVPDDHEDLSCRLRGLTTQESSCVDARVIRDPEQTSFSTELSTNTSDEVVGTYSMNSAKRGICLIVNNFDFKEEKSSLGPRDGTMLDEGCLKKVFEWLGFEVQIQRDCDREKILLLIRELSNIDHSQMDCLVCCVLSHGFEGGVYGVDGSTVKLTEIMIPLNGLGCHSLVGKPKLFFIQACQGPAKQTAVSLRCDGPTDTNLIHDPATLKISIPCDADFLLAVASIPSSVSYRDKKCGTWFIQALCQNLIKMVPRNCHLVDILTKVNDDVSQMTDRLGIKKQMSHYDSRLRKNVIFPVLEDPSPELP
ncbi:caspase-8 [Festucalex cinctus]